MRATHAPKGLLPLGHTTKDRLLNRYDKLKHVAKRHACVSVRLVLLYVKFADFRARTRAKLYFALKIHKYLQIERFLQKKMRLSAKNGKFL